MNYIGSKLQLCDFIKETIDKYHGKIQIIIDDNQN